MNLCTKNFPEKWECIGFCDPDGAEHLRNEKHRKRRQLQQAGLILQALTNEYEE